MWAIEYHGFRVEGLTGCDACRVTYETDKFQWETVYRSYRAAQLGITRHIREQRLIEQEQQNG